METVNLKPKINKDYKKPSNITAMLVIFKRKVTIILRYPSWFISLIIWPIIFPFIYLFTAKALAGTNSESLASFKALAGTNDYVTYMLIGTTMWMCVNEMLWSLGTSLRTEQVEGTLESNWLCPISKISLLFGYSLFQLLMNAVFIAVSLIEFKIIYGFEIVGNPFLALLVFLISIPSIYGLGFIFASLVMWAKEANSMVFLVRGIVMVFCGISYPLAVLPGWMKNISNVIPVTYSINALRKVIAEGKNLSYIKNDLIFLIISGIVLMFAGILTFNYTQKKVKELGSLGQY